MVRFSSKLGCRIHHGCPDVANFSSAERIWLFLSMLEAYTIAVSSTVSFLRTPLLTAEVWHGCPDVANLRSFRLPSESN